MVTDEAPEQGQIVLPVAGTDPQSAVGTAGRLTNHGRGSNLFV
jgi:hypothetical protein